MNWRDPDDVVVQRIMRGERMKSTKWEKHEAVRRLLAMGVGYGEVLWRLRISGSTMKEARRGTSGSGH